MMPFLRKIRRDRRGAAVIEMAFALPALIVLMWMIVQLGLVFRAMSGIQHGLGEGSRMATLFPKPTNTAIQNRITSSVYGIGPGSFAIATRRQPTCCCSPDRRSVSVVRSVSGLPFRIQISRRWRWLSRRRMTLSPA